MSSTPQAMRRFSGASIAATAVLLCWGSGPARAAAPPAAHQALEAAIHGAWRPSASVQRDKYRHPVQTLEFFGIRPDMRVVEVLPGGGWYTEILAPFLRDHGELIEAEAPLAGTTGFTHQSAMRFRQKLASDPAVYGKVKLEPFVLPDYMGLGAPNSADMVVTFRNMHDMMFENVHGMSTDLVLQHFLRSAYQVLKPGGVLGIEAHRANPDMPLEQCFKLSRVPEPYLIREAEQAGFRLAGTSEINANPKDPRTASVFYFRPSLSPESGDTAHYAALGEADDMELRFVKPAG